MKVVSVMVPVLNEESFVEQMVKSLLSNGTVEMEIFLIDGGSSDSTRKIAAQLAITYNNVKLVANEQKYVSYGFNKAFGMSRGEYIALLGAHAVYPKGYFDIGVRYLETGGCDAVGGPLTQVGTSMKSSAIAKAMSSTIGVGGTEFRTRSELSYVDSVPFAIYNRRVFEKIGLLDEELVRNQDDEFHYRMNANGFRILMVPEMSCSYYVRDSYSKLKRQYFEYGEYKPLVLKKVRGSIRLRHLVPATFVLYLTLVPVVAAWTVWVLAPFVAYLCALTFESIRLSSSIKQFGFVFISFITLHLSYGSGFLKGLSKL